MEPAEHRSLPQRDRSEDDTASREQIDISKKNEKTTRRGKLELRVHVGSLRKSLDEVEQALSGLKKECITSPVGDQRCLKRSPKPFTKTEPVKDDIRSVRSPELELDEKDIIPEKDVGFFPVRPNSKLPVLGKMKYEMPKVTTDILTKVVGLETLYGVLMEEHLGLTVQLQETTRRLRDEESRRRQLESRRNPINLALAERIGQLEAEAEGLRRQVAELREENDHLEFRLLEMDEAPIKKTVYRSSDSARYDSTDVDDVSDSGVMSLPASDDEHTDFSIERKSETDVKGRLLSLSQSSGVGDRICIQQGLALLRHYEARIEALESTIAAMCHEATLSRSLPSGDELRAGAGSTGRIIATVLPFKESCLQESGIFEECPDLPACPGAETASRGTQTEPWQSGERPGELSTELEKLSRIREKIGANMDLSPAKELAYCRGRISTLESRLAAYEASPDEASKAMRARLEKEARLEAEVDRLKERIDKLEEENRLLEEERCELEEAENDTRLRCQKLELKLSALGEKKNCLKAQLEHLTHEMAAREEDQRDTARMEAIVKNYEKRNQELEEREQELRYRLQMLESSMPALMMWNMWRMMVTMQAQNSAVQLPGGGQRPPGVAQPGSKEEELTMKLQALENRLDAENKLLQEARNAEENLRHKVHDLEAVLESKDTNILHILDRDGQGDVEAFEKLSKMAKERLEMSARIKDLEMKEKMYQETLQQVDTMFADMEGNFTKQLQEKDEMIYHKDNIIKDGEFKTRQNAQLAEMNMHLQDKMGQLEQELKRLAEMLKKREAEREALEKEERRLNAELQESLRELDALRREIEGPMKGQLEMQKKRMLNLEQDLEKAGNERLNMEEEHRKEVNTLKNRINQLNRDLMESDVTIGELREEVQTLEIAIDDLRYMMALEKADKEDVKRELEVKLEEKERALEELREALRSEEPVRSLKDELDELMASGDRVAPPVTIPVGPGLEGARGDYQRTTLLPQPQLASLKEIPEISDENLKVYRVERWKEEGNEEWSWKGVRGIEELMKEMEQGEALVDLESTNGILPHLTKPNHFLPIECQKAQNAISSSSGKDVKEVIENLTIAYRHSKICKFCDETLGSFLEDLLKELGVTPSNIVLGPTQV